MTLGMTSAMQIFNDLHIALHNSNSFFKKSDRLGYS